MKTVITLTLTGLLALTIQNAASQTYWPEDFVTENATTKYKVIGYSGDGLDSPVDLDFNKTDPTELWVISMRTAGVGGNTVTYRNVGEASQQAFLKKDGNSRHFMSMPTAIAFGANGNWGNSPGILDANFSNGQRAPFTGPSLWSSDFAIYAQNAGPGTNGSHLDMLHGSPHSVGIAWLEKNAYFVFDGQNGHVAMYDFMADHGPGNSNHDDGRLRRYPEISLKREGLIPSHMEIDPARKWLYVNDIGNKRIVRIDITSGNVKGRSSTAPSETLAENFDMENVDWEIVANTGLDKPCGLDVTDSRLIVTDNGTSELIVYDLTQSIGFPEIGRMKLTGYNDVMGVKLDEEGKIWFVDKIGQVVIRIDNDNVSKREADGAFVGIAEEAVSAISSYPNPVTNQLFFNGLPDATVNISVQDLSGRLVKFEAVESSTSAVDLSTLNKGVYILSIKNEEGLQIHSQRIIKQ